MKRIVEPELLDELPPDDPRAVRSRKDLQRVNRLMRHAEIIAQQLLNTEANANCGRLVELGAGDGTLLLSVAQRLSPHRPRADVILVDQQSLVGKETRDAFHALDWELEVVKADVFDWLRSGTSDRHEAIVANLFLHHFSDKQLSELLRRAAANTKLFVACEPRRTLLPWTVSHLLGLIGCNAVTRHDAVISVRAGFTGNELSTLWPDEAKWKLSEGATGLFSHLFAASRNE
ncbi:MAG: methyltransferase domain-containing protein [Verrucomicrobia bacterium]|nr:methyltransferase domain-containing protein [Verrucomicrobiota bacterium]